MDVPVLAAPRGVILPAEGGYQGFEPSGPERKTAAIDEGFAAASTQAA